MDNVTVGDITIGAGQPLCVIGGPDVIEDMRTLEQIAETLCDLTARLGLTYIFKASYEKDNRSSADSYRGPGLDGGLQQLGEIQRELGVPLLTDVHRPADVAAVAKCVDAIQVPALLCRQTSLLEAVGASGRPVNLKKGQFMHPAAMGGAIDKVRSAGGRDVLLTERGSCFGYERMVSDMTAVMRMRALGCPVVFDAGHAANGRDEIATLAKSGIAAGADALFVECHPAPQRALCDGSRMLDLDELDQLLPLLLRLARAVREA